MLKITLTTAALLLTSIPVMAQGVDSAVHDMCKEAKDYSVCVRAMTTDVTGPLKIDQTNRPGLLAEMGNSCPSGYAYSGSGRCRQVLCQYQGMFGRNQPELAGKGHSCKGVNRQFGLLTGRATLIWGGNYMNASNDPNCPAVEPRIGARSSCTISTRLPDTGNGRSVKSSDWDSSPTDYIPVED